MKVVKRPNIRHKYLTIAYAAILAAYIIFSLTVPITETVLVQYHINHTQAHLILISLVTLIATIWTVAYYGYIKLSQYAKPIRDTPDGRLFYLISIGLLIFALAQPVVSLARSIAMHAAIAHPSYLPTITIISNYLNVIYVASAFGIISYACYGLLRIIRRQPSNIAGQSLIIAFVAIAVVYCYLTFGNIGNPFHFAGTKRREYYLPDILLIATIVIPTLYAWFMGFAATMSVLTYHYHVKGPVYKAGLRQLAYGLCVINLSFISFQYVTSLTTRLSQLSLSYFLVLIYGLLTFYAAGFVLVALGAKKLKKIEEV